MRGRRRQLAAIWVENEKACELLCWESSPEPQPGKEIPFLGPEVRERVAHFGR